MAIQGVNLGLGEISTEQDVLECVSRGGNAIRILNRFDGEYGEVYQEDFRDDSQPHNIKPEKLEMLRRQTSWARKYGCKLVLGNDSDNLQGRRGEGFYDLFNCESHEGTRAVTEFRKLGLFLTRDLEPDYVEPIVEPGGFYFTLEALQEYQESFMNEAVLRGYTKQFLLGGYCYFPTYLDNLIRPEWLSKFPRQLTLTCNFADELCRDDTLFMDRLQRVCRLRDRLGIPVLVNQIWTDRDKDTNGSVLASRIAQLKAEGIDSIIWTACTKYKTGPGSMSHLANMNDPNSEHILHEDAWNNVEFAWRLA